MDKGKEAYLPKPTYTAWTLVKAYWQSESKKFAYFVFAVILVMTVALVGLDLIFSYWYNHFYNALQAYDRQGVFDLLVLFFAIAFVSIILAVYRYYISQYFAWEWRKWLTDQYIGRWLEKQTYYLVEHFDEHTDNPDQRIQEDVGALVKYTIDLTIGMVTAVTTLFAFVFVLWELSGVFQVNLGSFGTHHIPGYLVWIGILYAFVGTTLTVKIGHPLVNLNFEQQRREATFRFSLVDLRNHSEHVALYRGERQQHGLLNKLFDSVLDNWWMIILRQKLLLWFTAGYNQVSVVLPLLVALPNYFDGVFKLGGLIQTLQAFGKVQDSLSFIINSYVTIAEWQAIARRLTTFSNHMTEMDKRAAERNKLQFMKHDANSIEAKDVSITTPNGSPLLNHVNETFNHGSNYLIKGMSGIGKSTFIRALSGIWPFASGEVEFPNNKSVMYVPQRPYMPIGTLKEAILFPDRANPELEAQIEEILRACKVDYLIPRLNDTGSWSEQLSPGETQRIAFARVLLHKPDWVFMDESTSMLDVPNEKHLYGLLKERLPNCSVISVGHRPTLDEYHDHTLDMVKYNENFAT